MRRARHIVEGVVTLLVWVWLVLSFAFFVGVGVMCQGC